MFKPTGYSYIWDDERDVEVEFFDGKPTGRVIGNETYEVVFNRGLSDERVGYAQK